MTLVINSKDTIEEFARSTRNIGSTVAKKNNNESMLGYAKRYKACGFVPFTLNLGINKEGNIIR